MPTKTFFVLFILSILLINCLKPMENRMDAMLAEIKETNKKMDSVNSNMGEMKKLTAKMDNLEQMLIYMQEMTTDLKEMKDTFREANLGAMGNTIEDLLKLMEDLKNAMVGANTTDPNSMLAIMKQLSENMVTLLGAMTGADPSSLTSIMKELSAKMDTLSSSMGNSESGLIKVIEDMKNSIDFLKTYMTSLNEEMRKLREEELRPMNDSLRVFTSLLADLGVSGGGSASGGRGKTRGGSPTGSGLNLDNVADRVAEKLEGSSTGAFFKLVMQSEKDKILTVALSNYKSGSPEVRYASIGQIIGYGTLDPLITAFTGIDGGIMKHRPLNSERIWVNIGANKLELKKDMSGFTYNKVVERPIENPLEWSLGAAGVITQVENEINNMQNIPSETANVVDKAGIVAVFKMNELTDNTKDIEDITKRSAFFGKILSRLWPMDNLRINGMEEQSRLMVEWYAPRLACRLQHIVRKLIEKNATVKDFAKADDVTMQEIKYIAETLVPDTVKRYLMVQGYGPEPLAVGRRQKVIDSDKRRKGFSANDIQKVLDPDWKTYSALCNDPNLFNDYVDVNHVDTYPQEYTPAEQSADIRKDQADSSWVKKKYYEYKSAILGWFHL